ncbi:alpha/beta fold hydrolase [Streptomyces sp. S1A(2023)]
MGRKNAGDDVAASRPRRPSALTRALAVLALPVAPLYATFLSYLVYHPPRRPHHRKPEEFGLPSTELTIPLDGGKAGKGRSLHIWLCPGSKDRVVVIGHGIGLSKSASLAQARFLHEAGYTVAMFDHRNHGLSSTDRAFWGLSGRHTDDVERVVNHLREKGGYGAARFAVFGFSFSTFPSFYLLRRPDCGIEAIVCDSGPALELPPLFRNFIIAKGGPGPGPAADGSLPGAVEPGVRLRRHRDAPSPVAAAGGRRVHEDAGAHDGGRQRPDHPGRQRARARRPLPEGRGARAAGNGPPPGDEVLSRGVPGDRTGLPQAGVRMSAVLPDPRAWGTRPEELTAAYPCDGLLSGPVEEWFRAVTVRADRATVFRWLCQLKIAPYS